MYVLCCVPILREKGESVKDVPKIPCWFAPNEIKSRDASRFLASLKIT
jgi:hypothetical protein